MADKKRRKRERSPLRPWRHRWECSLGGENSMWNKQKHRRPAQVAGTWRLGAFFFSSYKKLFLFLPFRLRSLYTFLSLHLQPGHKNNKPHITKKKGGTHFSLYLPFKAHCLKTDRLLVLLARTEETKTCSIQRDVLWLPVNPTILKRGKNIVYVERNQFTVLTKV